MKYVVENGIKIPPVRKVTRKAYGTGFAAALKTMGVGDSMLISRLDQFSANYVARRNGFKIVTRTMDDGIRIWRVA